MYWGRFFFGPDWLSFRSSSPQRKRFRARDHGTTSTSVLSLSLTIGGGWESWSEFTAHKDAHNNSSKQRAPERMNQGAVCSQWLSLFPPRPRVCGHFSPCPSPLPKKDNVEYTHWNIPKSTLHYEFRTRRRSDVTSGRILETQPLVNA